MIDSGACRTVLRRNEYELICKRIGRNPVLKKAVDLFGVTGHQINVLGETQLDEQILGPITVIVVEGIGHPMVLGRDIMNSHAASLNYATSTVTFGTSILPMVQAPPYALLLSLGERPPVISDTVIAHCVKQHEHLFAAKGEILGCHPDILVRIETDGKPVKRRAYRIPFSKRVALDKKLDELLDQGVIVPSSSPWASPVVLVEKKDPTDGPRFCVDYTGLNKVTKKDSYPIPIIRDIFDQLQGATVFSTLDLKSGFYQLPLHPDDQE